MRASSSSFISLTCFELSRYEPFDGVSRQPIRFISVDLPDPDGPMIATYSPRSISIDTPRRAWISSEPMTYVFQRSRVSIRAIRESIRGVRTCGSQRPLSLSVLVLLLEPGNDRRIGQGGGVAERLPLGNVAQEPPHDLAGTGLRQVGREDDVVRPGDRANLLRDVFPQLGDHALGAGD